MPKHRGSALPTNWTANPFRRRGIVSVPVVLALALSTGPATAAAAAGSDPATKQERLQELRSGEPGARHTATAGTRQLQHQSPGPDTGKVAFSVKVRSGAGATASIHAVGRSAEADGGSKRRVLTALRTVSVDVPAKKAEKFEAAMRQRPDVTDVHRVVRRELSFIPNDENYPATSPYLDVVSAPSAWDVNLGDPAVKIAVVDSGVDVDHPDLEGRVSGTYNAVDGTADVTDDIGHGTFVAGVAAATADNGIGIAGASMGASVLAVKVADAGGYVYTDYEAAGIVWATDHGAQVINLSLGSAVVDQVETDAVAYAVSKGVLVVAAAGNDGSTAKSYPAALPSVIAVGATDAAGHRAAFSQYGSWVSVAAPGTGITATTPTSGSTFFQPGYDRGSGTSFSTPIVAAEAALLWSSGRGVDAAEVRAAIIASAHGYAGLGLGSGQVDFRAAHDHLMPETRPTLTAPAEGVTVMGDVTLAATSVAPKVQFEVDGTALGKPTAVTEAGASTPWPTWGLSNGPHTIGAVDCTTSDVCNTDVAEVTVTVANDAPVVTSPTPGRTLSGSATFTAVAPGGAVAFLVDGVRRGLDTSAPYALTYAVSSLADGAHTVQAVSCSSAGRCDGPSSAAVSFTALSLHPRFTSVSPTVFSPNKDGRRDTTKATWYLPDTETVRFQVRNSAGTVVRGPVSLGTKAKGTYASTWNGLRNDGSRAPSGTYRLELLTSRATTGGTLRGFAVTSVRVDLVAPTLSSITGNGTRFYPYRDGYRDNFSPGFTLNEKATVTLTVKNGSGTVVRTMSAAKAVGRSSITWNGRTSSGTAVAAGTYYWTLRAQDAAGNRRTSSRYSVVVSSKRLVTRTTTLYKNGSSFRLAGGTDLSCTDAQTSTSHWTYGVRLTNVCDLDSDGPNFAGAVYRFTLPSAVGYTSLRLGTYGYSLKAATLGARFTRWASGGFAVTPEVLAPTSAAWRTIGSVSPSGLVSSSRVVEPTVMLPNTSYDSTDHDIAKVRLVVTYTVLV